MYLIKAQYVVCLSHDATFLTHVVVSYSVGNISKKQILYIVFLYNSFFGFMRPFLHVTLVATHDSSNSKHTYFYCYAFKISSCNNHG